MGTHGPMRSFSNSMKSHPFLDSLVRMRQELTLEPLVPAMRELGNPESRLKVIQVTGTNGKGSTCAMLANGLEHCGLYTSPHLHELNERIQIDGKPISDSELDSYVRRVQPVAERHKLSFFETLTAVALLYFAEKKCNYAVLEVGLGGRLDATSIAKPVVSVITNVDYDHMHILGNTIPEIAREKAGIIKGGIVVTAERKPEALAVIRQKCAEEGATLVVAERKGFNLMLEGSYQQDNAACAYEALLALGKGETKARAAVETAAWPGRLERIGRFLFDCAHNEPAMRELAGYLRGKGFELVIAMKETKDHEKALSLIAPLARKVYVTQYTTAPFPFPARELYKIAKRYNPHCELVEDPKKALKKSVGFTVVAGSLFLVGELRGLATQLVADKGA